MAKRFSFRSLMKTPNYNGVATYTRIRLLHVVEEDTCEITFASLISSTQKEEEEDLRAFVGAKRNL